MISFKRFLLLSLLLPLCLHTGALSASEYELDTLVRTNYPATVMDKKISLFKYILEGTSYTIYVGPHAPEDAKHILSKRPPKQHSGRLTSRYDALLLAVGRGNSLVVDHENKLISVTENPINE